MICLENKVIMLYAWNQGREQGDLYLYTVTKCNVFLYTSAYLSIKILAWCGKVKYLEKKLINMKICSTFSKLSVYQNITHAY